MKIMQMHWVRLVLRSLLFVLALMLYILDESRFSGILQGDWGALTIIWVFFVADMLLRF